MSSFIKKEKNIFELVSKSFWAIFVRIVGLIFGLLFSIFLGNFLGPEAVGTFAICVKLLEFLTIFCLLGIGEILMKEVSISFSERDIKNIGAYIKSSSILIFIATTIILGVIFLFSDNLARFIFQRPELSEYLRITSFLVFFKVGISVISQTLKGLRLAWPAVAIKDVIPMALLVITTFVLHVSGRTLELVELCKIYVYAHILTFVFSTLFLKRQLGKTSSFKVQYGLFSKLIKEGTPLLFATSFVVLNSFVDVYMLTILDDMDQVGLYSIASRLGFLINFFIIISGSIIAPKIAEFYYRKDMDELKKIVRFSSRAFLCLGGVMLLIYILFGKHILSLWGDEFIYSYMPLIILAMGYFVNLVFGLSTFMLSMTGQQRILGRLSVIFGVSNIVINYFLIQKYGAFGAAMATTITLILENLSKTFYVKRKIGIYPISLI